MIYFWGFIIYGCYFFYIGIWLVFVFKVNGIIDFFLWWVSGGGFGGGGCFFGGSGWYFGGG